MKMVFVLLFFCQLNALSQIDTSLIKFTNPSTVLTPRGYSQSVEVDLGNCKMLIISGQVALDQQGNLIGKGDFAKQTEQVFTNIKNIVAEAGGTMNNVVKLGIYVTERQIESVRDIRNKFINMKNPPASTFVQVSKLFRDDLLIEIEATAIIQKK